MRVMHGDLNFPFKLCPKVGLCIVDECVLCSRFYGPLWILFSDVCTMNDSSGQLYTINSVKVQFPCKAYPSQLSMMDKVSMSYALCTLHVQDVQLLETDHTALCVKILSLPAWLPAEQTQVFRLLKSGFGDFLPWRVTHCTDKATAVTIERFSVWRTRHLHTSKTCHK